MYQCNVFSALHYLVVKDDSLHGKMSDRAQDLQSSLPHPAVPQVVKISLKKKKKRNTVDLIMSLKSSSNLIASPAGVQPTWKEKYSEIITGLFSLHLGGVFRFRSGSDVFWTCGSLFFSLHTSVRVLPKIIWNPVQTNAHKVLYSLQGYHCLTLDYSPW